MWPLGLSRAKLGRIWREFGRFGGFFQFPGGGTLVPFGSAQYAEKSAHSGHCIIPGRCYSYIRSLLNFTDMCTRRVTLSNGGLAREDTTMKGKLLLLVFVLAFAVPSFGGNIGLDFSDGGATGGVISLLGGGGATGVGVPIGLMKLTGLGPDQLFPVTGTCAGGTGCLNFDSTTGMFTIHGTADGITGDLLTSDSAYVAGLPLPGNLALVIGAGSDTKDPDLLAALGIAWGQPWNFGGSTEALQAVGGGYTAISTDVLNGSPTPEPVSMLLMGTFFSLAGGLLSKKKRA